MSNRLDENSYDKQDLITFDEGIFGFEENKEYLPLQIDETDPNFIYLLSVDDENISFVLVNPFSVISQYNPILAKTDYKNLETENDDDLSFYCICVMSEDLGSSTVNLKCPIVVNVKTRKAVQVILQSDSYKFKHLLKDLAGGM